MVAREVAGMVLMALAGCSVATLVILESVVKGLHLPYFALMGTANLVAGISLSVALGCRGELSKLSLHQLKWVWVRGIFGCSTYVLMLLAVVVGAPLGASSALQSINVVVAALLGRVFLGEPLCGLHIAALGCSFTGAVLVTQPQVMLGLAPAPPGGKPWLGYALALAAGTTSGSTFIAARRSQGINPSVLTASVMLHEGLVSFLLPAAGVVDEAPLHDVVLTSAGLTAAVGTCLLVLAVLAAGALSAGAQMCPAAAASTIYTSVNMALSFTAQVVLHSEVPEVLSVAGAGLLLLGVVLMAAARNLYSASVKPLGATNPASAVEDGFSCREASAADSAGGSSASGINSHDKDDDVDDDDTGSLASFVASEFAGLSPSSAREPMGARQRRTLAAATLPAAQVIGAASA
mmetsp:Transcript_78739/g.198708  ORF Transcript_78739/g.198708 Transcript_78739/m.198708 type:complete len:407 (-) Transcript_78739:81-1301(-)|eukprot:CAMPEP_0115253884 /NCGR_PEP_ID=MMETSP0270-20121206/44903_1 /TAXON_ID=71861 /ORGANISM="Scrippsiella trochoidea, Strain CCMP3099" /LENGTH=406 /DNA_ID=CAMNT_0002669405 /DNA_START=46 /DNA_END=1266 /DNA_ORIENTATION=+